MIVTLRQHEIESAVRAKLAAMLGVAQGVNFAITFNSGRGDNGLTATVDLEAREDQDQAPVATKHVQQPAAAPAVAANSSPLAAVFQASQPVSNTPVAAADPEPVTETPVEEQPVEEQPAQAAATPAPNKLFG